jgi:hypothetical protein
MAVWLERELVANLGVRGGFVRREQRQRRGNLNFNQPYDAFNVPTTIRDTGVDGVLGTADDGASFPAFNLAAAFVGLPTRTFVTNIDGVSRFDSFEIAMNKRMSDRWAAGIAFSHTWANAARTPLNPNSCINANAECQDETTDYSFKLNGSFELPARVKLSPVYRFQAGNNFARTFVTRQLNYANPTINAEPMNANRTANVNLLDIRIDRAFTIGRTRLSPFFDVYNLMNANAEQNITVSSGSSFLRPILIMPPRVMRLGAKVDW